MLPGVRSHPGSRSRGWRGGPRDPATGPRGSRPLQPRTPAEAHAAACNLEQSDVAVLARCWGWSACTHNSVRRSVSVLRSHLNSRPPRSAKYLQSRGAELRPDPGLETPLASARCRLGCGGQEPRACSSGLCLPLGRTAWRAGGPWQPDCLEEAQVAPVSTSFPPEVVTRVPVFTFPQGPSKPLPYADGTWPTGWEGTVTPWGSVLTLPGAQLSGHVGVLLWPAQFRVPGGAAQCQGTVSSRRRQSRSPLGPSFPWLQPRGRGEADGPAEGPECRECPPGLPYAWTLHPQHWAASQEVGPACPARPGCPTDFVRMGS